MPEPMDVDLPTLPVTQWNTASVSFTHQVSHIFPALPELLDAYLAFEKFSQWVEKPFPVIRFDDVCPPEVPRHESCEAQRHKYMEQVGTWTTGDGRWTMHLVLTGHDHDRPFEDYDLPVPVLFVRLNLPPLPENSCVVKVTSNIDVSLREPMSVKTVKGFDVETKHLGDASGLTFGEDARLLAISLKSQEFKRVLKLWTLQFEHPFCHFEINIKSTMEITRKFETSGIGSILQSQKDLINLITDEMTLKEVAILRQVCSTTRAKVIGVPERRLRLAIEPYFPGKIAEFCAALRAHGAIIGGSTVLSVLYPGRWMPNDLDLVVQQRFYFRFTEYLESQGYTEDELENTGSPYLETTLGEGNMSPVPVYIYHRFSNGDQKIDISSVKHNISPAKFILLYHSTAVMNFFDGSRIFCCFPQLTFEGKNLKNNLPDSERLTRALQKIEERGFKPTTINGKKHVQAYLGITNDQEPSIVDLPSVWYQTVNL